MIDKENFGVLYGQKTTEDALLIYSSYADSKASPQTGDFIVLAPKDESGTKYLARVDAEIYDEDPIFRSQDKTLVAVHYARIAERELSERDKQKIFSYTYKVKILGTFTNDGGSGINFTTAVRKLPTVSYHARHLLPEEIKFILNKDNQQEDSKPAALGHLCIGDSEQKGKGEIVFDINKLRNKRTMVFAQSGFGKTNLVKTLIYHAISDTGYGKLIFDLNGEYALKSEKTNGLGDINEPKIKDNLVVYTDKTTPKEYAGRFIGGGKVALNMYKNLSVTDILNFTTGFSEVMKSFLIYLNEDAGNFMSKIETYASDPQQLYKDFPDFWGQAKVDTKGEFKDEAKARPTIMGIRKRIGFLLDEKSGLHSNTSNLVDDVCKYLREGKTVVIDLSMKDSTESSIISTILVRKIFETNKASYTTEEDIGEPIPCVIFIEEAQNVLSEEFVKSNANPFVRIAKEGRKFGIGLVAITQRPSAISEEIRTQADNFFAFHMGNSDDIHALIKSNANYDGVIAKFIQSETISGNLYMVSSTQAFVLPIRVFHFEEMIKTKIYK